MTDNHQPSERPQALRPPPRLKRMYKTVSFVTCADGEVILLDGSPVLTPGRTRLVLPSPRLASVAAGEWAGQGEWIDPMSMPLTRLANAAIDGVAVNANAVREDIVKFAGSDLLCYRAAEPDTLITRQAQAWDPILLRFAQELGARFLVQTGIVFVAQPAGALRAIAHEVEPYSGLELAALHLMTTISGSALVALAIAKRWIDVETGFGAAQIDEDWNRERWGDDEEAAAARQHRHRDMFAAARVFAG